MHRLWRVGWVTDTSGAVRGTVAPDSVCAGPDGDLVLLVTPANSYRTRAYLDAELLDATLAKAREIAQWPVSSLVAIKQTLKEAHGAGIAAARKIEDALMMKLAGSPENIEAITAFMQKRSPDFKQFRRKDEA